MSYLHRSPMAINLIPLHRAIPRQQPLTLDVLLTVTPTWSEIPRDRIPLNLSLVIDRSGSMQGEKIHYARLAARFAVQNLLPSDRLSVVLFDHQVETLIPSTLATDKGKILAKIAQIETQGSTDLHGGWLEGGVQVSHYLHKDQLNRVIVLSDGLANVGEIRLDTIASHIQGLAQRGVSTTTLGLGDDYDEDMLATMALSGEGNFVHIQSANQLPEIFETELAGLAATLGQGVRLILKPQTGARVLSVLNDFDLTPRGHYKLPNLVVGSPIQVVVRLQIPAQSTPQELLRLQLSWKDRKGDRRGIRAALTLPLVEPEQMGDFPAHPLVQEQVALLMAARARREAISLGDRGDSTGARQVLKEARLSMANLPISADLTLDSTLLEELESAYEQGDSSRARKQALSQAYNLTRRGQSEPCRSMGTEPPV